MINGFVVNGWFSEAREIFLKMRWLGLEINEFCLSGMLGGLFDVVEGEQIHGFLVKMGILCGCSSYVNNALMNMYSRFGYRICAVKVFDENPRPDVVSWSGRINAAYDGLEAYSLFKMCVDKGLEINEFCITNTLSVVGGADVLGWGKQIHGFCCKDGYLSESSVCGALIFMYGKCGEMSDAERLFDEMVFQDSVSWNALISCYAENGLADQAIALFSEMQKFRVEINKYTLASVLRAASRSDSSKQAMQIHSIIVKLGFVSDESMQTCLMTTYGKCNAITESKRLFSEIDHVNTVHLNAMLSTFNFHTGFLVRNHTCGFVQVIGSAENSNEDHNGNDLLVSAVRVGGVDEDEAIIPNGSDGTICFFYCWTDYPWLQELSAAFSSIFVFF
ncbi:hypothetical protein ACET3Z_004434 [Daucus carota]